MFGEDTVKDEYKRNVISIFLRNRNRNGIESKILHNHCMKFLIYQDSSIIWFVSKYEQISTQISVYFILCRKKTAYKATDKYLFVWTVFLWFYAFYILDYSWIVIKNVCVEHKPKIWCWMNVYLRMKWNRGLLS